MIDDLGFAEFEDRLAAAGSAPVLLVLSGTSGSGKDTVLAELAKRTGRFFRVVTYTTRARRAQEVNGRDYHFVDRAEYDRLLADGQMIEHAEVYGNCYGVPRAPIAESLSRGLDVILRIDVQGAMTIKSKVPSAVLVFLTAPSLEQQIQRLRERGTESGEAIRTRIATVKAEFAKLEHFDYLLVNRDKRPDLAAAELESILIAERLKVTRGDALREVLDCRFEPSVLSPAGEVLAD